VFLTRLKFTRCCSTRGCTRYQIL